MRNLKKFLALVMAMVMAFSLMLSASAANPVKTFGDADQITEAFVEAADVLTGMKVFQGDEGGFRPGDNITRAEVAALIYRLATGDTGTEKMDLYTTTHPFTDVGADDWFAGYVGYCWNAGYIKGTTATTFNPYDSVTGYETLAMVLRAMGYDKNNEFTGAQWIVNVSATATQRGLLDDVKTTHYGNTLHLASRRDVVASILFQAAQKTRVVYTPAFGYQSGDHTTGDLTDLYNNYSSLGWLNFGLVSTDKGVVIGNQQTGEKNTRLGFGGYVTIPVGQNGNGSVKVTEQTTVPAWDDANDKNVVVPFVITPYAFEGRYDATGMKTVEDTPATLAAGDEFILAGNNDKFNVETGVDLMGHRIKIWFDGRSNKFDSTKGHPTYAYFDKAKTDVVYADNTALTNPNSDSTIDLSDAIGGTELKVNSSETAVFNNSFGKFGTLSLKADNDATDADEVSLGSGDGRAENGATPANQYASPVKLYKVISNNKDNTVDAVIALNIESSQITESNSVNRVPTIGLPVMNFTDGTEDTADTTNFTDGSFFVEGERTQLIGGNDGHHNLKKVGGVITGVLAKDALVGNSASALGDYEMGIHITGTTRRDVSANEATAINNHAAADKDELESSYFLLNKVTATKTGKVVAYNRNAGTVTLDDGTVLERSKFYDTVAIKNWNDVTATVAPNSAIPQGWLYVGTTGGVIGTDWVEGYANDTYKFYTDYEGKYLGAERSFGSTFLYGTYLDYDQKTSTSTFNYYLTGVTLDGEIETVQISKYWQAKDGGGDIALPSDGDISTITTPAVNINGTNVLGVPFRDTANSAATSVNGLGMGLYTGFAINGDTVDSIVADTNTDRNEHLANMARLGIKYAAFDTTGLTANKNLAFDIREIVIDNDDVTLGARETVNNSDWQNGRADTSVPYSNKYFTEATKFILVEGYGTDSVKAEVYNGISELKGNAARVFIKMNGAQDGAGNDTTIKLNSAWDDHAANLMTYYTESPYTYAQSGDTAMKIDTIILPKAAVSWSGGSGLYYVGNPAYSSINSWGTDAWKYDLYEDGELKQVWLTNDPSQTTAAQADTQLTKDSFYNLKDTGKKANDGEPIYTAGNYNGNGVWAAGTRVNSSVIPTNVTNWANQGTMAPDITAGDAVIYSAVTRDAQTATFTQYKDNAKAKLYRVAEAKVVNLNKGATSTTATVADVDECKSGEIWPGITDLATLNEAGSIDPVTGRMLKVAAVVDPQNPLVITTIYVCWDQAIN
ncbi:MAG: hypothetical protein HFF29_08600 [Oscillospiraceae bacterium]|nr:hypothetical protein [Oscillospiraceae bacterium]